MDSLFWEGRCFLCTVLRKNILYDQCLQNSSKCKYLDIFLLNLLHKAPKCVSTEAHCINIRSRAINLSVSLEMILHCIKLWTSKRLFAHKRVSIWYYQSPESFYKKNLKSKIWIDIFSHFLHLLFSLDDRVKKYLWNWKFQLKQHENQYRF